MSLKILPWEKLLAWEFAGMRKSEPMLRYHPEIIVVDTLDEADFVFVWMWGDDASMVKEVEHLAKTCKKPILFDITGDNCYVPHAKNDNIYFTTNSNEESQNIQYPVPYSYHESLEWYWNNVTIQSQLDINKARPTLVNFMGSTKTNPKRKNLWKLKDHPGVVLVEQDGWEVFGTDSEEFHRAAHSQLILDSSYTFCPKGRGKSSIRLVEAIMRGSIPVLLDDDTQLFFQTISNFGWSYSLDDNMEDIYTCLKNNVSTKDFIYDRIATKEFRDKFLLRDFHKGIYKGPGTTNGYLDFIVDQAKSWLAEPLFRPSELEQYLHNLR